ncbi:MAG: flagellar biosynthesis anti-sigma factor FlgM [Acidobacteriota bacterium]|nr:flagellar biosynthesis anti-sigma factor FlgM [Acidobacteriota bacterium]
MKISKRSVSSSYVGATQAYGKNKAPSEAKPVRESDSVEVSASGSLFQSAQAAVENVPDIRAEAVEPIQQEMADGSYHRDEYEVAEKVIEDQINTPTP